MIIWGVKLPKKNYLNQASSHFRRFPRTSFQSLAHTCENCLITQQKEQGLFTWRCLIQAIFRTSLLNIYQIHHMFSTPVTEDIQKGELIGKAMKLAKSKDAHRIS